MREEGERGRGSIVLHRRGKPAILRGDGKEEGQKGEGEDEERGSKVKGGLEERVEAEPSEPTWSSF